MQHKDMGQTIFIDIDVLQTFTVHLAILLYRMFKTNSSFEFGIFFLVRQFLLLYACRYHTNLFMILGTHYFEDKVLFV